MIKSHFLTFFSLIPLSIYLSPVLAANDWSKPCFNGTCSYDLPDDPSGPSGTLKIWGSNTAIADITTAGGWEIIGCDPTKQEQDIRIVCKGIDVDGDGDNDGCSHLFASSLVGSSSANKAATSLPVPTGTVIDVDDNSTSTDEDNRAVGKIVRLPEECGKQAFARIANTWTHENQTVPSHISKRLAPLHRRTQNRHKVKGITIDTQFHKSDSAQHGTVNFAIEGANVPGAKASSNSGNSGKKRGIVRSRMFAQRRGFGDLVHNVGDAIGDGAGAVGGAISDGAGAVGHAVGKGAGAVGDAISDGAGAVKDAVTGKKHFSNSVSAPIDISKTFTLFENSIKCSGNVSGSGGRVNPKIGVNGKLKVAVEAGVHGDVKIAVVASGSLTDLRVDSFGLTTTLNADLDGAIIMSAGVGGSIDSGKIKFFEVGIPGLDFPGIFSVGPTFQINGQAKVALNIDTDMRIGVVYHISDLQFAFPKGGKKKGSFSAGDTPLQLSAQPSAEATGKVEAHLIPSLNVGINAFEGVAKAEVFVDLDASASMTLNVDATLPSVQANVTGRDVESTVEVIRQSVRGRGAMGAYYLTKRSPAPEPFGFGDIVSGVKDGAKEAAGAVKSGVKKTAGAVTSGAKKAAGAVKSGAKKAAGAVESGAKKTASAVKSGEKKVAGAVEGGAKKVEDGAKKAGGAVEKGAKKVGGAVESGAKKVGGAVEKGAKKVGSAVKEGAKKVEDGAKKAGEAVKDGAKKVGGAVVAGAKEVKDAVDPPKSSSSVSKSASKSSTSAAPKATNHTVSVVVNDKVKFGGCLEMDAGLAANVGADADFFGLFNPSKTIPLFQKQFTLFKKCFGDAEKRRSMPDLASRHGVLVGRGLKCNGQNVSQVENLANQVVSAASLQ